MLVVTITLQILVTIGAPVALWLLVKRRPGVAWGLIGAGVISFVASQVVHLPINWALGLLTGDRGVALWPVGLMALVVGLSAGVCEEGARYLVLRFWRREARAWAQGVAFGAGHGGAEALLLGLLVSLNFVVMLTLHNPDPGTLGLSGEMAEMLVAQVDAYWSTPWTLPLLGALERVLALTVQIGLSLLVVRSLAVRNLGWLALAVAAHTVVDGVAMVLIQWEWTPLALEGVMLVFALGALALILALRRREAEEEPPVTAATGHKAAS